MPTYVSIYTIPFLLPYILHHTYIYLLSLRRVLTAPTPIRPNTPLLAVLQMALPDIFIARGRVFPCFFLLSTLSMHAAVSRFHLPFTAILFVFTVGPTSISAHSILFSVTSELSSAWSTQQNEPGCKGPVPLELFQPATIPLQAGRGMVPSTSTALRFLLLFLSSDLALWLL